MWCRWFILNKLLSHKKKGPFPPRMLIVDVVVSAHIKLFLNRHTLSKLERSLYIGNARLWMQRTRGYTQVP